MRLKKAHIGLILLGLWALSLIMPVARAEDGGTTDGWTLFMIGWLGPLILEFGWFANPIFLLVMIVVSIGPGFTRIGNCVLALLLLSFTADALFWDSVPSDAGDYPIVERYVGYYAWLMSMGGTGLWLLWIAFRSHSKISSEISSPT